MFERRIDEDHRVVGVVHDVRDLVGLQPQIDGVQHRAGQRDGQVELQVAVVVPRDRPDPVTGLHAGRHQCRCQPCDPIGKGAVVVPAGLAAVEVIDHLLVAEHVAGASQEVSDEQLFVLHGSPLVCVWPPCPQERR